MSAVHYLESGIAGVAIGIGFHYSMQYYKKRKLSAQSSIQMDQEKEMPNTAITIRHPAYIESRNLGFGAKDGQKVAKALQEILIGMGFEEGGYWKQKNDREKVFLFTMEYGDQIVIHSSISKDGKGKNKKNPFIRKTIKIGIIDKMGDYVEDLELQDMKFPKLSSISHSRATLHTLLQKLNDKIRKVSCAMLKKYREMAMDPPSFEGFQFDEEFEDERA